MKKCVVYTVTQPFKWLLSLTSNALTIKFKQLRPGLIHYDHIINAEIILEFIINLTLLTPQARNLCMATRHVTFKSLPVGQLEGLKT